MYVRKTLLSLFIALCLTQVDATGNDAVVGRGTKESEERLDTTAGPSPLSGIKDDPTIEVPTVGVSFQVSSVRSETTAVPHLLSEVKEVKDQNNGTRKDEEKETKDIKEHSEITFGPSPNCGLKKSENPDAATEDIPTVGVVYVTSKINSESADAGPSPVSDLTQVNGQSTANHIIGTAGKNHGAKHLTTALNRPKAIVTATHGSSTPNQTKITSEPSQSSITLKPKMITPSVSANPSGTATPSLSAPVQTQGKSEIADSIAKLQKPPAKSNTANYIIGTAGENHGDEHQITASVSTNPSGTATPSLSAPVQTQGKSEIADSIAELQKPPAKSGAAFNKPKAIGTSIHSFPPPNESNSMSALSQSTTSFGAQKEAEIQKPVIPVLAPHSSPTPNQTKNTYPVHQSQSPTPLNPATPTALNRPKAIVTATHGSSTPIQTKITSAPSQPPITLKPEKITPSVSANPSRTATPSLPAPVQTKGKSEIADSIPKLKQPPAKSRGEIEQYANEQMAKYSNTNTSGNIRASAVFPTHPGINREDDEIKEPFNEVQLLAQLVQLDGQQKLAVVYIVNTTIGIQYDEIFRSLAKSYTKTTFFRVDFSITVQFKIEDDFAKPLIYLRKYGFTKDSFEFSDESKLNNIIEKLQDMNRQQFINADVQNTTDGLNSQLDNEDIDESRENQYGGHFGNGLQHAMSVNELAIIFTEAKLYPDVSCVMYIVKAGNKHDSMVRKLASKFTSTFFIKITSNTYSSTSVISPYSELPEPSFSVYRFGQLTQHFSFTDRDSLKTKISNYINMDKEQYIKTITYEGKEKEKSLKDIR